MLWWETAFSRYFFFYLSPRHKAARKVDASLDVQPRIVINVFLLEVFGEGMRRAIALVEAKGSLDDIKQPCGGMRKSRGFFFLQFL